MVHHVGRHRPHKPASFRQGLRCASAERVAARHYNTIGGIHLTGLGVSYETWITLVLEFTSEIRGKFQAILIGAGQVETRIIDAVTIIGTIPESAALARTRH